VWASLAVALLTVTCYIGAGTSSDPFFSASGESLVFPDAPTATVQPTEEEIPPEPEQSPTPTEALPTAAPPAENSASPILYYTQAGDTLPVVAKRFGVQPNEIYSPEPLPENALLPPNQLLIIPSSPANTTSAQRLLPDSEVVFSPSSTDFDIQAYVKEAGGYLSTYTAYMKTTGTTSGADIVKRVALENSINPRLLLSLLEFQSGWVFGQPGNLAQRDYPLGLMGLQNRGLYTQLVWAVNNLSIGYYGWREGYLTEIEFSDGVTGRLAPDLNAGTVALQYYFARLFDTQGWVSALDSKQGFPALYEQMFGNPWLRAPRFEPLYPPELTQPPMILPFLINQMWSYTGGPHGAWEHDGSQAALDFAPASLVSGCVKSDAWVVAAAAGLVVRSGNGVVVIDLDGDGYEQTGWVLLYLHLTSEGKAPVGKMVETGDILGHPSCEGGKATGTHIHMARKYNGEWIPADGPVPFNLNGWVAHAGTKPYLGTLTRDDDVVSASVYGSFESRIRRDREGF
jgi:murein DD-endopeptidase MepM/ murein hydrolase activator NlpD